MRSKPNIQPRKGGRLHALLARPEIVEQVRDQVRIGNTLVSAAALAGIGERTIRRWLADGERIAEETELEDGASEEGTLSEQGRALLRFFRVVRLAQAEAARDCVVSIKIAGVNTWQAAAWWLERRYPEIWGRKRVQVVPTQGCPYCSAMRAGQDDQEGDELEIDGKIRELIAELAA